MSDVVDTVQPKLLRRAREARRGPALPHRARALRGRHRAAEHAARRVRAQHASRTPTSTRSTSAAALALDGRARRRHRRRHRRPGAADHVQLDVPVVAAHGARCPHGRPGAVRRRDRRRRGRRRPLHRRGRRATWSTWSTSPLAVLHSVGAAIRAGRRPAARRLGGQLLRQAPPQGAASPTRPSTRPHAVLEPRPDHAPPARASRSRTAGASPSTTQPSDAADDLDVDADPAPRPHRPRRRAADAREPDPRGRARRRRRLRHQGAPVPRGDRRAACWRC